jgi:hypothetical protein
MITSSGWKTCFPGSPACTRLTRSRVLCLRALPAPGGLLDPAIDGRERACRVLTERLASLHEAAKIERVTTGGAGRATTARIDHVADLARRHSLQVLDDDRGRPVAVGAQRLNATVLVARLLAGWDGDKVFGEVAFRAWSGATHDMLWSLSASLDPQPDPSGQHELIAHRRLTLDAVEQLTTIAAMAFGEAWRRSRKSVSGMRMWE